MLDLSSLPSVPVDTVPDGDNGRRVSTNSKITIDIKLYPLGGVCLHPQAALSHKNTVCLLRAAALSHAPNVQEKFENI